MADSTEIRIRDFSLELVQGLDAQTRSVDAKAGWITGASTLALSPALLAVGQIRRLSECSTCLPLGAVALACLALAVLFGLATLWPSGTQAKGAAQPFDFADIAQSATGDAHLQRLLSVDLDRALAATAVGKARWLRRKTTLLQWTAALSALGISLIVGFASMNLTLLLGG